MLFSFENGEEEWCDGTVTAKLPQKGRSQGFLDQEFEVIFDDYPNETFRYKLYEDFLKGDLEVIGEADDSSSDDE